MSAFYFLLILAGKIGTIHSQITTIVGKKNEKCEKIKDPFLCNVRGINHF
jgi:hypothetical protein